MRNIIGASANRAAVPGINNIKSKRCIDADGWMQCGRRLPGAVTDAANIFFFDIRFLLTAPGFHYTIIYTGLSFNPFNFTCTLSREESTKRAVPVLDISSPSTCQGSIPMRISISISCNLNSAVMRKTEFKKRFKPTHLKRITGFIQIIYHFLNILVHIMRQHKFIMQFGSPSHQSCL